METSLTFQHNFSGDDDANDETDYGTNDTVAMIMTTMTTSPC